MNLGSENKPNILIIGPVAPPVGGMTVSLNNLITSALKEKYNIFVLDITGYRSRNKTANIFLGIRYQAYLIFKLICILIKKKPCIVHVQMASFFNFYRRSIDIIICKLFGKKVILHLRGANFVEFFNKSSLLGKCFIKFILNISDKVISLSKFWHDFLVGIMNPETIATVPNGVICSDFKLVNNKKEELGFPDSHIFVLFMGPIGKRKGAFDILDAISIVTYKIKDVSFIFSGFGEFKGELEQFSDLAKQKNLTAYVKYVGDIFGQEKYDYYLSSDVFVLPSYAENLPNSLVEAMAAGLPVVVSDVGAIPEIVEDGVNGFIIKPGNINAIADRIIKLANDSNLRKSMGQRNLKLAKEKYDMPIIAEKIDKVYQELLKK